MARKVLLATVAVVVMVSAAALLYMWRDGARASLSSQSARINESASHAVASPKNVDRERRPQNLRAQLPSSISESDLSKADAATTYELVETNLRCHIDREASRAGEHVPSTTDGLCKDLLLDPMSREEVFKAITFAAENGDVRAQLDYSLYASRIFEDDKNSLNPDLIKEYKENTVRFLKSAGESGQSQAYVRLSDIYKNGSLAPQDPVMAYAYAEAYVQTSTSRYGASFLSGAMSGLDSTQLRRGKEIASQILNGRSSAQ